MTAFFDDNDSDEDFFIDNLNENYHGGYVIDINYNRPLKNYPLTLNKIDEVDETSVKSADTERKNDENGNPVEVVKKDEKEESDENRPRVMWDPEPQVIPIPERRSKQRPKSASCAGEEEKSSPACQRRPNSSCSSYPSKIPVKRSSKLKGDSDSSSGLSTGEDDHRPRSAESKVCRRQSMSCSLEKFDSDEFEYGFPWKDEYPIRPTSACCMRSTRQQLPRRQPPKRSNSQPNIARKQQQPSQYSWSEFSRFKRSLRLLGLSCSDFGLPESPKRDNSPLRPRSCHQIAPTFYTKVLERTMSLDCLREVIREAAKVDFPGLPQRRLLAQAAYEEWYFKKTAEFNKKLKEEHEKAEAVRRKMEEERELRKEKASERFSEWMHSKKEQQKKNVRKKIKLSENLDKRLMKSKEEIDKAYLEWKKQKQKDLDKKREKQVAEAEKLEKEKAEKEEKKALAEKVFLDWKKKNDEALKTKKKQDKVVKEKIKEQITAKNKSSKSFQTWKDLKDGEIKAKWRHARNAIKEAEAARSMMVTERMYEAEQAFEEWLDKVDLRKQKDFRTKTTVPKTSVSWAPV